MTKERWYTADFHMEDLRNLTISHLQREEKSILKYLKELTYDLKVVQAKILAIKGDMDNGSKSEDCRSIDTAHSSKQ